MHVYPPPVAMQVARMKAFCLFVGSSSSPMFLWLQEQGVHMIQVRPSPCQKKLGPLEQEPALAWTHLLHCLVPFERP